MLRVLALLLLCAGARGAETETGPHTRTEIGARAVRYRPDDSDGARWGKGLQLKLGGSPDTALQLSFDDLRRSWAGHEWHVRPLQVTALGYLTPQEPTSLYLLAGMGWYWLSVNDPGAHTERTSRPHAGAGVEMLVGKWSLDASYRFLWSAVWRLNDFGHAFGSSYTARGAMLTLGATRSF